MIKHISLASSSKGNCHLISQDDGKTYIMLDAGITLRELKSKLFQLKIGLDQIKSCLITHEHQDHFKAANDLMNFMKVYGSSGTLESIKGDLNTYPLEPYEVYDIDGFRVMPFNTKHNAKEPFGFIIRNEVEEFMLYLTDTGQVDFNLLDIRFSFVLIEANYDDDLLQRLIDEDKNEENTYLQIHAKRNLMLDVGHLGIKKTIQILDTLNLGMCKQIVLCHLSPTNSLDDFAQRVWKKFEIPTLQLEPNTICISTISNETKAPF